MSEENEVLEEVEEAVKAAPKKRGYKSASKPITGKIKSDDFTAAIGDIQKDSYVSGEQVAEILTQTMQQAYLEWSYPGLFKDKDSEDPAKELIKCEIDFSNSYSKFTIYDIKTVTDEDDIVVIVKVDVTKNLYRLFLCNGVAFAHFLRVTFHVSWETCVGHRNNGVSEFLHQNRRIVKERAVTGVADAGKKHRQLVLLLHVVRCHIKLL